MAVDGMPGVGPSPAPSGSALYSPASLAGAGWSGQAAAPIAATGPSFLDPETARPAVRRLTLVAVGWLLALVACTAVGLVGLVVHRGSIPHAPPGGRVARGVVRETMTYGEATVYEVRLRGGRDTVVVPGTEVELRRGEEVYVELAASGRPVGAEEVRWLGMAMMVCAGFVGLFAFLGFLARFPSAITIRQQFATGLVLSDARAAGSAPQVGISIGGTIVASLLGALFGYAAVAMRRRYAQGPARLQLSYPSAVALFLEAPRTIDSLHGAPIYVPSGIPTSTARGVYDARAHRIVRVRRKPLR